ncbi:multidrug resistance-associated protein 1-like isoform X2 [Mya arenaria]|uniref:multidrug resistance-associated protein 1-like isoform X2 n=1 Tax=Mya arenaria TaxID=6604 RepID=UPI0022E2EE48|nr:multidrug resistance-associated protein 1-like isoform X2 [Mya arenaria]
MDKFCGGEQLWNTTLTWGNSQTYPSFTECFQNTVLVWISSGWLLLASLFYMPKLLSLPRRPLPNSRLYLAKLVLGILQIIIIVIELVYGASELNRKHETYFQAYFLGPFIEGLSLILVLVYIELERRKGQISSGIISVYWTLANITYIIPFYKKLFEKEYSTFPLGFVVFNIYFLLSLIQLVLCCFVHHIPAGQGKKPCQESRVSFFSRIYFQWIQSLVVAGYKKPLVEDDMFTLNTEDQSANVIKPFEKIWKEEKTKFLLKKRPKRRSFNGARSVQFEVGGSSSEFEISETTPLLTTTSSGGASNKKKQNAGVSLYKVIFRTYGLDLLLSNIWKLFYDLLVFVNPFLLRFLIDFAEDSDQPQWKGYVYSAGFIVVIILQSLFFHNMTHKTMTLGIRVRSALISSIFKKSLTTNNQARTESTTGEIVNLMSVDAEHVKDLCGYIWGIWSCPLQIILSLIFLYFTVGYSMFAGLGVMVLLVPLNWFITTKLQGYEEMQMAFKDSRIKLMTEILNGIKILKLYAWEIAFGEKVTKIRGKELNVLLKQQLMYSVTTFSWTVAPFAVGLATFATYIFTKDDHRFDPQTAFVAMTLFNILRFGLNVAPMIVMELIKSTVSIKRIQHYLNSNDIDTTCVQHVSDGKNAVSIRNGTFSWDNKIGPCLKQINLDIPRGSLVAVVGSVGAGKSSLLSAILGEMDKVTGTVNVDGSLAYVSQQAWIQNASVKDNILFGNALDETRYDKVVESCSLKSDLDILPAGDDTEIGEKGINLSGGQKQRVSVARAVYFDNDIYILDDPLSAVDSHVGKHIFENVVGKDGLLKEKTRILVTHGIHWLPSVDRIIVLTQGRISEVGSYDQLIEHDGAFASFLRTYLTEHAESDSESEDEEVHDFKVTMLQRLLSIHSDDDVPPKPVIKRSKSQRTSESVATLKNTEASTGSEVKNGLGDKAKLIDEEEVEVGNVKWGVYAQYARAIGLKYTFVIIGMYCVYEGLSIFASVWLSNWTSDPDLQDVEHYPPDSEARRELNDYYLSIYGELGIAQGIAVFSYAIIQAFRAVRASKHLHRNMLMSVLRAPMSFFDTTPVGRIVNRFSQDVESVDMSLPEHLVDVIYSVFSACSIFIIILYSTPIFVTIIVPIGFVYICIQRFYIPTSRQLKRLESKTRSPIYSHFGESLSGVSTIRAFGVQDRFILESETRLDCNQEYAYVNIVVNRWLGIRLEILGAFVVLGAALFSVLERENINSSIVGLSVSYALQITDNLTWLVRMVSEFETNIVSVERIAQYSSITTEASLHTDEYLSEDWPSKGEIQLCSYSTRYREGLPLVLKSLDVNFSAGQRIGIVGRTGAGKSSLTLALFRLIEPSSGKIIIDGRDVSRLGLADLRSRLTILPQEPVLFSGSLRMNLDPMDEQSDSDVWDSLEHAHLKTFVEELPTRLEYEVGEGGQNLSVGQRQLVCLARSLLRRGKILVLDEATAAVDLETDALIQDTIRQEFKDCTVLTIAHRLNTVIDYDRILVLSEGEVKEFDNPQNLLQDTRSIFYSMAKDAGLV